jgi:hypothetical protein
MASSRLPTILGYLLQLQDGTSSNTGPDAKDINKVMRPVMQLTSCLQQHTCSYACPCIYEHSLTQMYVLVLQLIYHTAVTLLAAAGGGGKGGRTGGTSGMVLCSCKQELSGEGWSHVSSLVLLVQCVSMNLMTRLLQLQA